MTVIQKLRVKMIFGIVLVLMFILAVIIFVLNLSLTKMTNVKSLNFLEMIADNGGHRPLPRDADIHKLFIGADNVSNTPEFVAPEVSLSNDAEENEQLKDFVEILTGESFEFTDDDIFGLPESYDDSEKKSESEAEIGVPASSLYNSNSYTQTGYHYSFEAYSSHTADFYSSVDSGNSNGDMVYLPFQLRYDGAMNRNYFSVRVSSSGSVTEIIKDFPLSYSNDEISSIVKKILSSEKKRGVSSGIAYLVRNYPDETKLICLIDRSAEMNTLKQLYIYSLVIYLLSSVFAFLFALGISVAIVKPVESAFEKQKTFVADAGHELKTPIAVISANIDVLMADIGDNRWLQYIKTENERMGYLVKSLLQLARNDADRVEYHFAPFDLATSINNAVLPFESVIFEDGKTLELDIPEKMPAFGDEPHLKQVIIILVDNAIKNSDKGALIRVKAFNENQKSVLKVYNTGHGIKKEDLEKIFLRFYRSDSSRARKTGGYGLGLAIARTIAEAHYGTLTAASEKGKWAEFTLTIPLNQPKHLIF